MISWRLGGKGSRTDWLNYLINDKGVYRTVPATPGLLISDTKKTFARISYMKDFLFLTENLNNMSTKYKLLTCLGWCMTCSNKYNQIPLYFLLIWKLLKNLLYVHFNVYAVCSMQYAIYNVLQYALYWSLQFTAVYIILQCTMYCSIHYTAVYNLLQYTIYCSTQYTAVYNVLQYIIYCSIQFTAVYNVLQYIIYCSVKCTAVYNLL